MQNSESWQLIKKFNQDVKSQKIDIEHLNCLCGKNSQETLLQWDRHGLWQPIKICNHCGLLFNDPCLTSKAYENFYSSDLYRTIYDGDQFIQSAEKKLKENYGHYIYECLQPFINVENSKLRVLEIGCAAGWNLISFNKDKKYEVVGYDYSTELTKLGRQYGLNTLKGSIKDLDGLYDIIILNHVIEHFVDLNKNMQDIMNHLSENGIIYIGVPNLEWYEVSQFQNAHVYYFTPENFKFYMLQLGLENIKFGQEEGIHMYGVFKKAQLDKQKISKNFQGQQVYTKVKKLHARKKLRLNLQPLLIRPSIQLMRKYLF